MEADAESDGQEKQALLHPVEARHQDWKAVLLQIPSQCQGVNQVSTCAATVEATETTLPGHGSPYKLGVVSLRGLLHPD